MLDKTRTAMGHRLIRAWMERPLLSPAAMGRRLGAVEELVDDAIGREERTSPCGRSPIWSGLSAHRLQYRRRAGPGGFGNGLGKLPACGGAAGAPALSPAPVPAGGTGRPCRPAGPHRPGHQDDPPFSVREGGFIRDGYDAEVDRLRDILVNGKDLVAGIEAREKERTGIKSLKVGYNKVFGYYIEVSKSYYDQVPDTYA